MAYVMTGLWREPSVPSSYYYNGILEGYQQNGLPIASLKRAWEHSVKEVHAATKRVNSLFSQPSKPLKRRGDHDR